MFGDGTWSEPIQVSVNDVKGKSEFLENICLASVGSVV